MSLRPTIPADDTAGRLAQALEHGSVLCDYLAGTLQALKRRDPQCPTNHAWIAVTEFRAWSRALSEAIERERSARAAGRDEMRRQGLGAGSDA